MVTELTWLNAILNSRGAADWALIIHKYQLWFSSIAHPGGVTTIFSSLSRGW